MSRRCRLAPARHYSPPRPGPMASAPDQGSERLAPSSANEQGRAAHRGGLTSPRADAVGRVALPAEEPQLACPSAEDAPALVERLRHPEIDKRRAAASDLLDFLCDDQESPQNTVAAHDAISALLAHGAVSALVQLALEELPREDASSTACDALAALEKLITLDNDALAAEARAAIVSLGLSMLAAALSSLSKDTVKTAAHVVLLTLDGEHDFTGAICGHRQLVSGLVNVVFALPPLEQQNPTTRLYASLVLSRLSDQSANRQVLYGVGAIKALVSLLKSLTSGVDVENEKLCEACADALNHMSVDSVRNAEVIRSLGGVSSLLRIVKALGTKMPSDSSCLLAAVRALCALATCDALHLTLVTSNTLAIVAPVVRNTACPKTRLTALLLLACAYSGQDDENPEANSLLGEYKLADHLEQMLKAVVATGTAGSYLDTEWSAGEVCTYTRDIAVSSVHAEQLVEHGVPALLVQLLRATTEIGVKQSICRALSNIATLRSQRDALCSVGVVDALTEHVVSSDRLTACAASGALVALGVLNPVGSADSALLATPGAAQRQVQFLREGGAVPHYKAFLSHKRADAKDFARGLYNYITGKGFSTFLDYEYKQDVGELTKIAAACDNFIFILTDNVFDSEYCMLELRAAVLGGAKVITVRKEGALWPCAAGGPRTSEYPGGWLIETLDPVVRPTLEQVLAIGHSNEYYDAFCDQLIGRFVTPEQAAQSRAIAAAAAKASQPPPPPPWIPRAPPLLATGSGMRAPVSGLIATPMSGQEHSESFRLRRAMEVASSTPVAPPGGALASSVAAQLPSELIPLHEALQDMRRELCDLRRDQAASTAAVAGAMAFSAASAANHVTAAARTQSTPPSLAMVTHCISAAGVASCAALLLALVLRQGRTLA